MTVVALIPSRCIVCRSEGFPRAGYFVLGRDGIGGLANSVVPGRDMDFVVFVLYVAISLCEVQNEVSTHVPRADFRSGTNPA